MSKVSSNIAWLMLVQCSGYIFPLIMLPYLVRTLGVNNFGIYSIVLAIIQYGVMLTEFGFNFTSTREISLNRNEKKEVSKVFFSTIYAKLLLFFIFFCGVIVYLECLNKIHEYFSLLVAGGLTVFANALYPIWFFQGIEKVKIISIVTAISRAITLLLTLLFVKTESDLHMAILVNSFLYIIPSLFGCALIFLSGSVIYVHVSLKDIYTCLKKSFPLFISNVSISLYSTLNTIVLGKYSSPTIVGNFAAADKLRLAVQGLYAPIQQAVFPRASQGVMQDGGIKKVIKVFGIPFIMFGLIISLSYLIFGNFAVRIYYGEEFALAGTLFSMMFPLPLIISIATVFTHWVLIAQGQNKIVGKIYTLFSLVHLCYVIPFVKEFDAYGMVYSVVLTQSLITLAMIACVIKSIKRSHE